MTTTETIHLSWVDFIRDKQSKGFSAQRILQQVMLYGLNEEQRITDSFRQRRAQSRND